MLFVRYVLSFLRWNDLFSNRTSLNSGTRSLTFANHHSNAFCLRFPVILSVILDVHNVQRQDPLCIEVTKLSFSYSWDVLNFLSAMKCYFLCYISL